MNHIGIDLGGRESQVCARESDGTIIDERRVQTAQLPEYLRGLPTKSRVVMETCAEAFYVADAALAAQHEARVVAATLVRSLGVGARGIKTDVRDARVQSEASCRMDLPSVHIPSRTSRELKTLLNMRDALVTARTQLCNTVRGYLRSQLLKVRCTPETMPKRVRATLSELPTGLPAYVERQLVIVETLNEQIAEADKELAKLASEQPTCRLLMTAPAVGPVTSMRFVTSIDEVSRFESAHALESYLGLTPGEDSSSGRQRRTGLTKAGPSGVRKCLVQVCWTIYRLRPDDPLCQWGRQLSERRSKQVAVSAMARKLAGVLYAMWRDQRPYEVSRLRRTAA